MHQTQLAVVYLLCIAPFIIQVEYGFRFSSHTCYGLYRRISSSQSGPRTCLRKRNPDPTPGRQGYKANTPSQITIIPLADPVNGSQRLPDVSDNAETPAKVATIHLKKRLLLLNLAYLPLDVTRKRSGFGRGGGGEGGGGAAGVGWQLELETSL